MTAPPVLGGPPPPPCDPALGGFTELEADGFRLFTSIAFGAPGAVGGNCIGCHNGPLLSAAAATDGQPFVPIVPIPDATFTFKLEDPGFFNIGTRPVVEDRGVGGTGQHGNPLSFSRQYKEALVAGDPDDMIDGFDVDPCTLIPALPPTPTCDEPTGAAAETVHIAVDGAFKTPSLRNVALTPPYFHYGGYASLTDVIDFYARGGSRRDMTGPGETGTDSGTGPHGDGNSDGSIPVPGPDFGNNTSALLNPLNLALDPASGKDQEYGKEALVAFMKTMTDSRVQCDMAPFDHPALVVFNGHYPFGGHDGKALDEAVELPAVGQNGYSGYNSDLCLPNAGDLFAPGMRNRISPY